VKASGVSGSFARRNDRNLPPHFLREERDQEGKEQSRIFKNFQVKHPVSPMSVKPYSYGFTCCTNAAEVLPVILAVPW
jgi:hypothetical protein